MRFVSTIMILLLFCSVACAQMQNNNWCFGYNGGVSFNTSPPSKFISALRVSETTAGVSNRHTGKLLFYTNGYVIFNATHNSMLNSGFISPDNTYSSAQGAVIVPFVNDTNKYYVFTLSHSPSSGSGGDDGVLRYSVVDMTLDTGRGGVVPNQKAIPVDTGFIEAMTTVSTCDGVWVILMKRNTQSFYAYKVTDLGFVSSPVVSQVLYNNIARGTASMKVSPDKKRLVLTSTRNNGSNGFAVLNDFDVSTGVVSHNVVINPSTGTTGYYGCEFSPDSKKLYLAYRDIYQLDLSLPTDNDILNSRKEIFTSNNNSVIDLQIAPDSNIYTSAYNKKTIGRITNCNSLTPAYNDNAVAIDATGHTRLKLPQPVGYAISPVQRVLTSRTDTLLCINQPITLVAPGNKDEYTWQNGDKGKFFVTRNEGVFWVRGTDNSCVETIDTVVVNGVRVDAALAAGDTTICSKDTITLIGSSQATGAKFEWSTGDVDTSTIRVHEEGKYTLRVSYLGCSDSVDMTLTHYPFISIELGNDTQVCRDAVLRLPQIASADDDAKFRWQDGSTSRIFDVIQAGKYRVELSNQCQTIIDSITVTGRNCYFFFPSAFTPNGDGRNDIARLVGDVGAVKDFSLSIFNRWGELVYLTNNSSMGWGGYYKGQRSEVGIYYYQIRYTYLGKEELMKGDIMLVR